MDHNGTSTVGFVINGDDFAAEECADETMAAESSDPDWLYFDGSNSSKKHSSSCMNFLSMVFMLYKLSFSG